MNLHQDSISRNEITICAPVNTGHSLKTELVSGAQRTIKNGIWLYFILLIFEGALRKWALPGLATPLLVIRDPLALFLILKSLQHRMLPSNIYLTVMATIGITGFFAAILTGHGNLFIALYGSRIFLLQFPLIFVIGQNFTKDDVIKMGKIILLLSIPMTVLIALQFYSIQSAWINRGVGGDLKGSGFDGALGYYRPSGTFSFTTGNSQFYAFVASFLFYFWFNPNNINRLILLGSTAALLIAIPLSISRALFFQVAVSLVFAIVAASRNPTYIKQMVFAFIGLVISFVVFSHANFFQTAIEAFSVRFDNSNTQEGGLKGTIGNRYLGNLTGSLIPPSDTPFFGYGSGLGTNVASSLLSGNRTFLVAEEEWPRLIAELGPLLGLTAIFTRLILSARLTVISYKKIKTGDLLPWMLLSFGLFNLPQGQWAVPTSLGFGILSGGLLIASVRGKN